MKPPASTVPSEVFEPFSKWQKDQEGNETLVLQVPDFKKEQLRVRITSRGLLRITGERPLDSSKRKRFDKEVTIPKDCDPNQIRSRLAHSGELHIAMPKKTTPSTDQGQAGTPPVNQPAAGEIIPQPKFKGTMASWVLRVPRWDWKVVAAVAAAAAAVIVAVAVAVALGSYAAHKYRYPVVGPSHSNYSSDL